MSLSSFPGEAPCPRWALGSWGKGLDCKGRGTERRQIGGEQENSALSVAVGRAQGGESLLFKKQYLGLIVK